MAGYKNYEILEISGKVLTPGFSIYLLEIIKAKKRFFYIGMTGDPFYPSARAAFHRLSGHLEKNKHSKQNQLWNALRDSAGIKDPVAFSKLKIKMHHFPISGFKKWSGADMHHQSIKEALQSDEYKDYKGIQAKVLAFEKSLIRHFEGKLLNNTKDKSTNADIASFKGIKERIAAIIANTNYEHISTQ